MTVCYTEESLRRISEPRGRTTARPTDAAATRVGGFGYFHPWFSVTLSVGNGMSFIHNYTMWLSGAMKHISKFVKASG